jgi:hypothetical protein
MGPAAAAAAGLHGLQGVTVLELMGLEAAGAIAPIQLAAGSRVRVLLWQTLRWFDTSQVHVRHGILNTTADCEAGRRVSGMQAAVLLLSYCRSSCNLPLPAQNPCCAPRSARERPPAPIYPRCPDARQPKPPPTASAPPCRVCAAPSEACAANLPDCRSQVRCARKAVLQLPGPPAVPSPRGGGAMLEDAGLSPCVDASAAGPGGTGSQGGSPTVPRSSRPRAAPAGSASCSSC